MPYRQIVVAVMFVLIAAPAAWSQQGRPQPPGGIGVPPKPSEVRIFHLKYLLATEAADVAMKIMDNSVGQLKIAPDERSNSLIVSGTNESLKMLEAILEQLDSQGVTAKGRQTVRKYKVRKDISLAHRVLMTLLKDTDARMEESGDSIIVFATDDAHNKIEAILSELSSKENALAAENYYIHLVWIVSEGKATKEWSLNEIPPSLRPLVDLKLAPRLGLKSPKMVGQLLVRTTLNGESAEVNASGSGELSDNTSFELLCDANMTKLENGVTLRLDLNSTISGRRSTTPGGVPIIGQQQQRSAVNNLGTTITLKLDHPVCLGTTPTNGVNSVFLIQVSKDLN